jgi:hypothetical protein
MKITQHEKILIVMIRDFKESGASKYFRASDFQKELHGVFIGYEATARMSELIKNYPFLFATRQNGRFREAMLLISEVRVFIHQLPSELARHFYLEKIC